MKVILNLALILLISCQSSKDLMRVNQVFSDEKIALKVDDNNESDSINIVLPVEFEIKNVSKKVADVGLYYKVNNKMLERIGDYMVYNGETGEIIYAIEDLQYNEFPKSILLKQSSYKISKEKAEIFLKKYGNYTLEKLHSKKQVEIISYKDFREENPEFIKNLEKNPDSLILSIAVLKEKPQIIRKKINW